MHLCRHVYIIIRHLGRTSDRSIGFLSTSSPCKVGKAPVCGLLGGESWWEKIKGGMMFFSYRFKNVNDKKQELACRMVSCYRLCLPGPKMWRIFSPRTLHVLLSWQMDQLEPGVTHAICTICTVGMFKRSWSQSNAFRPVVVNNIRTP